MREASLASDDPQSSFQVTGVGTFGGKEEDAFSQCQGQVVVGKVTVVLELFTGLCRWKSAHQHNLSTDGLPGLRKRASTLGVPGTVVSSQEVCQQGGPGTVLVHPKSVGRIE